MYVENTDTIIRQTRSSWNYQPGKAQLCLFTFSIEGDSNGVNAKVGPYDGTDGLYFEKDEGIVYACIKKAGTVVTRDPQADWVLDKFNGQGVSRIDLQIDKVQIGFIDFE